MKTIIPLIAILGLLLGSPAMAASSKRMTHSIEAASFTEVNLEMAVGEMDIEVYDGDTIELDIEIIAERRWFSLRRGNVDDVQLTRRERGETLYLGIDEDNLDQTWHVRLPAHLAVDLDVGVGDIQIDDFSNSLVLELGVGAVEVNVVSTDYAEITATAGVGDAVIRGFGGGTDNERSLLVGADAFYAGDGQHRIEIEVGVGDARVRAR
ncbi:MAG: hypothetical protein WD396_07770 [Pseudohongiellaceae bacterium]